MTDENAEVEALRALLAALRYGSHTFTTHEMAERILRSDWLAAREAAARAEALREAADGLYLSRPGQHNEGAKDWLHRRANLIDPRTRDTVCEHGYSRSVECGYCEGIASIARTDGAGS